LSEYPSSFTSERLYLPHPRALEGIRDELLEISDRCDAPDYERNKADVRAVRELAETLRDAIVEYQVRTSPEVPHYSVESFADTVNSSHNKRQYMNRTVD